MAGETKIGDAIKAAARRGKIDPDILVSKVEKAVLAAAKKTYKGRELEAQLDSSSGHINLYQALTVVERVNDPLRQIPLADVRKGQVDAGLNDELLFRLFYRQSEQERAQEQAEQFTNTTALQFEPKQFEKLAKDTAENLLRRASPASVKTETKVASTTGLGRRVRRGAVYVDPLSAKIKSPLPKEVEILQRAASVFGPGQIICREGDQGRALLLMMKGEIDVLQNEQVVNTIKGEVQFIGLLSYFTKGLRTATLRAHIESHVVHIPEGSIGQLFRQAPSLALRMLQDLSELFLKREEELKRLKQNAGGIHLHAKFSDILSSLALVCATNSDVDLRSYVFNHLSQALREHEIMTTELHYPIDFIPTGLDDEHKREILTRLKNDARELQKNQQGEGPAHSALLKQMNFDF